MSVIKSPPMHRIVIGRVGHQPIKLFECGREVGDKKHFHGAQNYAQNHRCGLYFNRRGLPLPGLLVFALR